MSNKYIKISNIADLDIFLLQHGIKTSETSNNIYYYENSSISDSSTSSDSSSNSNIYFCNHTTTSDDKINYYENANNTFKKNIKNNQVYKDLYNYWCDIVMGHDENFVGKFNEKMYIDAYTNINKNLYKFINNISDENSLFFFNVFKKIIDSEYFNIINKKNIFINNLLKNFDKTSDNSNCFICTEKLNKKISLKLPCCKNSIHRTCLKKWLMESSTCPICRTKFE